MLSKIIVGAAGMGKEKRQKYYPRPSSAGPERCIRQMTYHARSIPEDTQMGDRLVIVLDDSSFHEELTADWIRKTTFQLSSQQMSLDSVKLDFLPKPDDPETFPLNDMLAECKAKVPGAKAALEKHGWRWCNICEDAYPANVLHGHIDGVITDMLGIDRLWEHKAINHFTFEKYWKGTWPLDYITQCCIYIIGLRKVNPDINQAVLLIKNKNTSQYMDMVIEYDEVEDKATVIEMEKSTGDVVVMKDEPIIEFPNIIGDAVKKFEVVDHHTKNETLPDRPYEVGTDYPCTYCSWQETCWEGYEEEFSKLIEDIALEQEMEERCRYYLEKDMHLKADDKEVKELKAEILQVMRDLGAKSGRVGPYAVKIMQRKTRGKISEWIRITKPKKKER